MYRLGSGFRLLLPTVATGSRFATRDVARIRSFATVKAFRLQKGAKVGTCACSSQMNCNNTQYGSVGTGNGCRVSVQIRNNSHCHPGTKQTFRNFSSSADSQNNQITDGERQLRDTIGKCFPKATNVVVEDISGGCGSMYSIFIEAPDFQGMSTVKQHLLVNKALKQEIKSMHGIRIQTAATKSS